jgi:hypothetical protein
MTERKNPRRCPAGVPPKGTDEGNSVVRQLRARRAASYRLVPLDCGCRDPWPCRCTEPPLTDVQLDGWRDAAKHVLGQGRIPLLPIEVRRALWRRGSADRALAEELHQLCGGLVS